MNIIDAYCGLGPWRTRDVLLPYQRDDIVELMQHFGISRALAHSNMATSYTWYVDANASLMDEVGDDGRFMPSFALAPDGTDEGRVEEQFALMGKHDARAVWLLPQGEAQAHGLWPWLIGDILTRCIDCKLPVFLKFEQITPDDVHRLCSDYPDLRLVLCGVGYICNTWLIPLMGRHPNLRVCLGQFMIPPEGPVDIDALFRRSRDLRFRPAALLPGRLDRACHVRRPVR